jgi:hypothetical protein
LIGHKIKHKEFVVNILEGTISGKNAAGRPRLQYLEQVARNTEAEWPATIPDGKLPTSQNIEG